MLSASSLLILMPKVVVMPGDADFPQRFELLQSGLVIVAELEEQTDNDSSPQLDQARSYLAQAGQKITTSGFDSQFSKAMGLASSVAIAHEDDELAEDALELGGDHWFEDGESSAEIVTQEPDETYRLTTSRRDNNQNQIEANNPSGPPAITDGGAEINTDQGQQGRCSNCGQTRNVAHTAEAGTTVGDYLGLAGSSTADVCTRCWSRIPEEVTQSDDFGLLEFEGWERQITTSESRFVSATWESDDYMVNLDAVGDGEWTLSWFGENEGETDNWYGRYEARQSAIDKIQRAIRLSWMINNL
jgi:hypothetical protein